MFSPDDLANLDRLNFEAGEREETPPNSVVYFIMRPDGAIKIGYTAAIKTRRTMLSRKIGSAVEVLATRPGGRLLERAYHFLFADHWIEGEWFSPHSDILAEVARVGGRA